MKSTAAPKSEKRSSSTDEGLSKKKSISSETGHPGTEAGLPVFLKSPGVGKDSNQTIAADGVKQASTGLPYQSRIQASFGHHDVSSISSKIGGPAADASSRLGAHAYTIGRKIGFKSNPDLRLAAHEAAHVVQQRRGVSQKNRVAGKNDFYEQQADAVAGRVVSNQSAEGILDTSIDSAANNHSVQAKSIEGGQEQIVQLDPENSIDSESENPIPDLEVPPTFEADNPAQSANQPESTETNDAEEGSTEQDEGDVSEEIEQAENNQENAEESDEAEEAENETMEDAEITEDGGSDSPEVTGDPDSREGGGDEGEADPGADLALIDTELAEHERWAGSFGEVGTAGSDERAQFILDQAGQGAASGAVSGLGMGFVMGAVGGAIGQIAGRRLATLAVSRGFAATPVPGLGPAIGGVMALAGLATRDWGNTFDTIGRFGEGEGYGGLANDLEAIAEVLDLASNVADVVGGVLGAIAVGMWIGAVLSAGTLSPLALSLSAVATAITIATTAIGVIINVVIRPTVTALRALHAFESQGDPAQIEAEGQQLQAAAGQVTGAVAGAAGGRLGGAAGSRGGTRMDNAATRLQQRRTGGAPAMTATASGPRVHLEVPEAPVRVDAEGASASSTVRSDSSPSGTASSARPAATDGPMARSSGSGDSSTGRYDEFDSFAADLNASPEVAALRNSPEFQTRLTDTRAPLPTRSTPWNRSSRDARRYANTQAARHRTNTAMQGGEVQAGHTAAARHAYESGIREADWDTQPMMDLHSRRRQGLDVTVTGRDSRGRHRTRTRTRHTAQELIINDAVARSREAQGGQLTPRGQLDAAEYTRWVAENTPWEQGNVDMIRNSGSTRPDAGPAVDPSTGRVVDASGPAPSSPSSARARSSAAPASPHASHTETARTTDRASAMAQYQEQIRLDSGRESGVWRGEDGTFYVMQGDSGSVAPPTAAGRLELVYHSHPTDSDAAMQGLVSQPSQAQGDIGVLQHQHGQGEVGARQQSELHFPTYDDAGNHSGYGATQFTYDPTHPLPVQVQTTLPGGEPSIQRYASFADFEARTGIQAGGTTPAASTAAADTRLRSDVAGAQTRIDDVAANNRTGPHDRINARQGSQEARDDLVEQSEQAVDPRRPVFGPAYTASVPGEGLEPGTSIDIPINPAYPEPPGTTAELDALQEQIARSRTAQSELQSTEGQMQIQAGEQIAHGEQLVEAEGVTQDLQIGRSSHQSATDSTLSTNNEQQSTADDTVSTLTSGAEEASGLATLVVSLRGFQGLAHLFSYLPGSLGRSAANAKDDAEGLITSLNRVTETEAVESNVEQGKVSMEADQGRIEGVSEEGQETDTELEQGQQAVADLTSANIESIDETNAVRDQATRERRQARSSEDEAQTAHDNLHTQLQSWANEHQQAREHAIASAIESYNAQGYEAREGGS